MKKQIPSIKLAVLLVFGFIGIRQSSAQTQIETVSAGSYVIAMDNTNQALLPPFNLKAYGLVYDLLNAEIPLKWIIKDNKVKDANDFSAKARRRYPTITGWAAYNFKAGPFIIPVAYKALADPIIAAFGNSVAVYELQNNENLEVRYTLSQKKKNLLLTNGGNEDIHRAIYQEASIKPAYWDEKKASQVLDPNFCYTFASEPHWGGGIPTETAYISTFVNTGGNFHAQCAGIHTYETLELFQSTNDFNWGANDNDPYTLFYPDEPIMQFQSGLEQVGGSHPAWKLNGGSWKPNTMLLVRTSGGDWSLTQTKKTPLTDDGGFCTYQGAHDNEAGIGDPVIELNHNRIFLNASLVPSGRPSACAFDFGRDLAVTSSVDKPNACVNDTVLFTIRASNIGMISTQGVTATDALPAGFAFVSYTTSQNSTYNSGSGIWNIDTLKPAEADTLFLRARLVTPGTRSNPVSITFPGTDDNPTNNSASVSVNIYGGFSTNLSGGTTLCEGDSAQLTLNITGTAPWSVIYSDGVTNFAEAGIASSPHNFSAGSLTTSKTYTLVSATDMFSCKATSLSGSAAFTLNPASDLGSPIASLSTICVGNSTSLSTTGNTGDLQWQWWDGLAWVNEGPLNTNPHPVSPVSSTKYRLQATSGVCPTATSADINIAVDDLPSIGAISAGPSPICEGSTANLSSVAPVGDLQWQWWNGASWVSEGPLNANPRVVSPTINADYRLVATNGVCPADVSAAYSIVVDPAPVSGTASVLPTAICLGNNANLSYIGQTGDAQWQEWSGAVWADIGPVNSNPLSVSPGANTDYRIEVTSGICPTVQSNVITLQVDSPSNAGGPSAIPATICEGSSSDLATGGTTGNLQWQEWNGASWINIGPVNDNPHNVSPILDATYQVVATNGVCPPDISASIVVTVDGAINPGTPSLFVSTICDGGSTDLSAAGQVGDIQWQEWNGAAWVSVGGLNANPLTINPSTTTDYRIWVTGGVCSPDSSGPITLNVDALPNVGVPVASPATICDGGSADLTTAGTSGDLQWQRWTGAVWVNEGPLNDNPRTVSPVANTNYQLVATNGVCTPATSGSVVVTVNSSLNPGTPSLSATTICNGNSSNLMVAGQSGDIQWQENTIGGWVNIGALNANPLAVSPSTQTDYRLIVSGGVCPIDSSATVTLFVDQPSMGGVASLSEDTICVGVGTDLNVAGTLGNTQWQAQSGGTWNNIGAVNSNPLTVNPSVTTNYHLVATNGVCTDDISNTVVVFVSPYPVVGAVSTSSATICEGGTSNLLVSGSTGTQQWQEDTPLGWTAIGPLNSSTWPVSPLNTTNYRLMVSNNICPDDSSAVVTVTVDMPSEPGILSASADTICEGNSTNITAAGTVGDLQWQLWNGTSWTNTGTLNDNPLVATPTANTNYQVIATNGVCPSNVSVPFNINVDGHSVAGIPTSTPNTVCVGDSASLEVVVTLFPISGASPGDFRWQKWDGTSWQGIGNLNQSPLKVSPVADTDYRIWIYNGTCPTDSSSALTLSVDPLSVAGIPSISADTICEGETVNLTHVGSQGTTQWQVLDAGVWTNIGGPDDNPLIDLPPSNSLYQNVATSGVCPSVTSGVVGVVLNPAPQAGQPVLAEAEICQGENTNLSVSGTFGTYQWQTWTGSNWVNLGAPNTSTINVSPATNTNYRVISATTNCPMDSSLTVALRVDLPAVAGTIVEGDTSVCEGENIALNLVGYFGSPQWQQTAGTGVNWTVLLGQTSATTMVAPTANTSYRVTLVNGKCSAESDPILVSVDEVPEVDAGTDQDICGNTTDLQGFVSGGNGTWSGPTAISFSTMDLNPQITSATHGTFECVLTGTNGACSTSERVKITLSEAVAANAGEDQEFQFANRIQLNAVMPPAGWGKWTVLEGAGEFNNWTSPTTSVKKMGAGRNVYQWETQNGACTARDEVVITMSDFVIPTGFSPNDDGTNDYFVINGLESMGTSSIQIFNRWGMKVYESTNYENRWGGEDSKGRLLDPDTYYFILNFEDGLPYPGSVTVRR